MDFVTLGVRRKIAETLAVKAGMCKFRGGAFPGASLWAGCLPTMNCQSANHRVLLPNRRLTKQPCLLNSPLTGLENLNLQEQETFALVSNGVFLFFAKTN